MSEVLSPPFPLYPDESACQGDDTRSSLERACWRDGLPKPRWRQEALPDDRGALPELSPEEQEEAEMNLRAYLELVVRIYEGLSKEPGGKERIAKMLEHAENGESPE